MKFATVLVVLCSQIFLIDVALAQQPANADSLAADTNYTPGYFIDVKYRKVNCLVNYYDSLRGKLYYKEIGSNRKKDKKLSSRKMTELVYGDYYYKQFILGNNQYFARLSIQGKLNLYSFYYIKDAFLFSDTLLKSKIYHNHLIEMTSDYIYYGYLVENGNKIEEIKDSNFEKLIPKYVGTNEELMKKINAKRLRYEQMRKIVTIYNEDFK